jgi:hypothetical protein
MHANHTPHTHRNDLLVTDARIVADKKAFIGMSSGSQGVPIDILTLLLGAKSARETLVLCTDAFQKINGIEPLEVMANRHRFEGTVAAMSKVFSLPLSMKRTSKIIASGEYSAVLSNLTEKLHATGLMEACVEIVPLRHRSNPKSLEYPVHQLAMCEYLSSNLGFEVKLGPHTEVPYDSILAKLNSPLRYAYATDALPLASKGDPRPVVHYVSGHRENGVRLMCDTPIDDAMAKIAQSSHAALLYLYRLAREAGRCLWRHISIGSYPCFNRGTSANSARAGCCEHPCTDPRCNHAG